jgi:hypothetical protein
MEVGHDLLTTQIPSTNPFLYTTRSVKDVSLLITYQTKDKTNGEAGTNVGLAKTIGDDMGCLGISSNKIPTIRSLRNIIHATPIPIKLKALTDTGVVRSCEE